MSENNILSLINRSRSVYIRIFEHLNWVCVYVSTMDSKLEEQRSIKTILLLEGEKPCHIFQRVAEKVFLSMHILFKLKKFNQDENKFLTVLSLWMKCGFIMLNTFIEAHSRVLWTYSILGSVFSRRQFVKHSQAVLSSKLCSKTLKNQTWRMLETPSRMQKQK